MATKSTFSWQLFHEAPIIGIIRNIPQDILFQIAKVYEEAGLSTLEVTMNTEWATDIIAVLSKDFPNLNIGAGTVCTKEDLNNALNAGAQFIVTPIIEEEVIRSAVANKLPVFPGAFSPTEIYKAWTLGASAVKVFPASQLGVKYIKEVSAPLNNIKLLPTGGVSLHSIKSFFEAGAFGVGMGSSLLDKVLIRTGNFDGLKQHFLEIKSEIEAFIN